MPDGTATEYHLDVSNIDGFKKVYVNGVLKINETDFDYDSKYEFAAFGLHQLNQIQIVKIM